MRFWFLRPDFLLYKIFMMDKTLISHLNYIKCTIIFDRLRDSNPLKSSDFYNQEIKMTDRNSEYMRQMWGTTHLVTDYTVDINQKMLREISNDDITPKKHNFKVQNEIHSKIRNDIDYDDWEYGTEPIPLKEWS